MEVDEIFRLERALSQRIYVMDIAKMGNGVSFEIMGSTGYRSYTVQLTQTSVSCSCPDFEMRGCACKHILNVFCKVLKIDADKMIEHGCDAFFYEAIARALELPTMKTNNCGHGLATEIKNVRDDTECSVCYEPLKQMLTGVRACTECKHIFHIECVNRWLRQHTSCPLCRARMVFRMR